MKTMSLLLTKSTLDLSANDKIRMQEKYKIKMYVFRHSYF